MTATGRYDTMHDVLGDLAPPRKPPAAMSPELTARIPARRRATSEEIASAAVYLASEGAAYVNGAALPVVGGWLA